MTKPSNKSLSINKGSEVSDSVNPNFRAKRTPLKSREEYVEGIKDGNRTILSQAITLIESSNSGYRKLGQEVLEEVMPLTGNSVRIGITGVPGVGKSTFIEAIGNRFLEKGEKLAVLAIDPTSTRTKGSILGDKTRMATLSTNENAYIRPSPTSGTLGGVARTSRETMLLCEAAGYTTIFIETVGVGQSETTVHNMVDMFLLLMLAGAGDELQGIKRGIMEMADLIAINKAEEDNKKASERARQEYKNALSLFPPAPSKWKTPVVTCSALEGTGIEGVEEQIQSYISHVKENSYFQKRRKDQSAYWIHETIRQKLTSEFYNNPAIKEKLAEIEEKVNAGEISSFAAAELLLKVKKKNNRQR
ncbi:methylmalonyl Co-A mutase-associated GTPase MeaB [Rhodohalobacter sp. SW132]|uniref:methylmalonyl Co-A mutase-associated GTPase MeaB n=1 Tax=Rhodohalobacter sp. SW132 TaxID=2293433 RepID=UPI000E2588EC|nr:methylmalonyl Co-A mutase-associated GTPase MeaB [Rhodohalobacter sp. SW132]REL24792.1 methylmalonyl Co-A mutase-associated GTPase MeaB [Rhodohalobacter sp. SW132]